MIKIVEWILIDYKITSIRQTSAQSTKNKKKLKKNHVFKYVDSEFYLRNRSYLTYLWSWNIFSEILILWNYSILCGSLGFLPKILIYSRERWKPSVLPLREFIWRNLHQTRATYTKSFRIGWEKILYDLVYIPKKPIGPNKYLRTPSFSSVADYLFKSRWSKKF